VIILVDDDLQLRKALALFEYNDIFIAETVILETERVLRYAYEFPGSDINISIPFADVQPPHELLLCVV